MTKGFKHSEETKARISRSMRARHARAVTKLIRADVQFFAKKKEAACGSFAVARVTLRKLEAASRRCEKAALEVAGLKRRLADEVK